MTTKADNTVLTEKQINQKMAGHKSNYTKKVQSAKTAKERKSLESKRDAYLAERLAEIMKENRHRIMVRAGYRAWDTRRANSAKCTVCNTETNTCKCNQTVAKTTAKRAHKGSKVGIRVISK